MTSCSLSIYIECMILRRLGNKKKIAKAIQQHFPPHRTYIEPFFGAGGLFFHKPKARYNLVNDLDQDVFNLFQIISTQPEALKEALWQMPIHETLWDYWKTHQEKDPIRKAIRFIFLSNFGYLGKASTMRFLSGNTKRLIYEAIDKTSELLFDVEFTCCDFRELFRKLSIKVGDQKSTFIYCDPPYLETANNYQEGFTAQDTKDLFEILLSTGCKFAISEFEHPVVMEMVKKYDLDLVIIGERRNLKNRRVEVLVKNYQSELVLF